ncbi:hypothetical protein [Methylovulum psychrotolerans]|uniref:Uncharacterized protein n=1 Tax=Methylovulum psychrotolerans TaxID=1704499 RepID=A0A2S5CQA7_9GAMM|nr:hypothetical protein [Methylovulum psychrotolerans]POZ52983.1 hypothetical protein AADEFJLK_01599 [Methylovulum psychrotolerans]
MTDPTPQETFNKLMMSQTFTHLAHLAQSMPIDTNSPEDLKTAFSTCGIQLMDALDNGRIHFDDIEDKALLMGLLAVTVDYAMDGKLKGALVKASIN